jgi:Thiamine pyrophosphate-requiring enzymes [acetolactate synthase, pyruvate dehydrogenase (cytochrome), glyoxylate carboligase, phosphonopyruvate decarboxylase]
MTIDVATGIVRILKEEGVGWVSTFPVCRVNNALGREGVPMLMMRDDRYAVAVADAFSRITAGSRIGVCTFQGGVNAAGMQYAYAGMAQAYEDGSPVLCITDGVPAGSSGNSQYDVASAMKTVSKWFGYLDKPERTPELMRRAFTMLRSGRPGRDPGCSQCHGDIRRDRRPVPPGEGLEIGAGPGRCEGRNRPAPQSQEPADLRRRGGHLRGASET